MVAEAELVCQQSVAALDVKYFPNKGSNIHQIEGADAISPPSFDRVRASDSVSAELSTSQEVSFSESLFFFLVIFCVSIIG